MKLYRLGLKTTDGSEGFQWFASKVKAEAEGRKFARENPTRHLSMTVDVPSQATWEVDAVEITLTVKGILHLLNIYASHPDNG